MATSGSINFNLTTQDIITEALEQLGVLGPYDSLSGEDYASCLKTLNMMVKSWQAQGLHLWTETEAVLFLSAGQNNYQIGNNSSDKASAEMRKTELASAGVTSATTLTVDSTANMTASDVIGIVLDSGATHWTTIVSVDSSTTLTITSGLASAASVDNHVYFYTTALAKPLRITNCRILREDGTEVEVREESRTRYMNYVNKTLPGRPNQFYADYQRDHVQLYLYPTPNNENDRLVFSCKRIIEDFDDSTDTPDLPQEWLETIVYNLAVRLAPKYHKEEKVVTGTGIAMLAAQTLELLKGWDSEKTSLKFVPNLGYVKY